MQRIERYGVIALLFLLVTVLAFSMWGEEIVDPKNSSTQTLASVTPTRREPATRRRTPARTTGPNTSSRLNSQVGSGVPLSNKIRTARVQTRPMPVTNTGTRNQGSNRLRVGTRRNTTTSPAQNDRNRELTLANSGGNTVRRTTQPLARETNKPNSIKTAANRVVTPASNRAPAKAKTWTVQRGETLSEISQEALGSASLWIKIAAANPGVDPNRLSVGTKLVLPSGLEIVASQKLTANKQAAPKSRVANSTGGYYTVQSGDVLSKIAQRELGSAKRWREIVTLNPSVDPNRLAVGTKLVLPAGGVARSSQSVSTNSLAVVRASKPSAKQNRVR